MKDLAQRQIDRAMENISSIQLIIRPQSGWIRAIRGALGMTHAQLARKLKIAPQSVRQLEISEKRYTISLMSLEKVAEKLNCKLFYTLIPNEPLEKMVAHKIEEKAKLIVSKISKTMALEDQKTRDEELEILINNLKESYKSRKNISFIWDEE